jgi:hypothetical protein
MELFCKSFHTRSSGFNSGEYGGKKKSRICFLAFSIKFSYSSVHVSYDPDIRSPAFSELCQWASEGNVSITPCHPSYMASGSYHGGTFTRK